MTACDKKPGGQVIAVVNSEEITQQELRAEAEAAGVPAGQDVQTFAPLILNRVIERNLLADSARDQGLDRGPEYVGRRRQLEQSLLATLALRKLATASGAPTPAEVRAFIQANPAVFARRERLALDQLRFPTPSDPTQVKALTALGSLDAIEAKLRTDKTPAARGRSSLDTGTVESMVARQIAALPNGQIFDLSANGGTFISAITARTPAAVPSAGWTQQATGMLRRERTQKTMVDAMAKLRADAKIEYDPAFKPKAAR
ncbi:peptidyl-prolyl cis-trans isomerase [uncultured Sphingomonas sp.]|uniref:peptidyl-prolyl cis-trans isomerase n=1 Tax=uncultured Sphingomonas sp. TaxID=158754 RepID=UPI0035CCA9AF